MGLLLTAAAVRPLRGSGDSTGPGRAGSALRDKNLTGGSVPPVLQTVAADQRTAATLKRRSPRGVRTTATSPARRPRSASATGDSIESLPSPGADSREETSL